MMRSFLLLALTIAAATAFAPPVRHGVIVTQRTMFSPNADDVVEMPSPLEVVVEGESIAPVDASQSSIAPRTMIVKNLAKGGEVKQGEST